MRIMKKQILNMQKRVWQMQKDLEYTYSGLKDGLRTLNSELSDLCVAESARKWSRYPVITLCGSTRFKNEFMEVQKRLTLDGYITLTVVLFGHSGDTEVWEDKDEGVFTDTKKMLDDMHKQKIDISDEIFVINVDGYIGDSTRGEIEYARERGKKVRYMTDEPEFADLLEKHNV